MHSMISQSDTLKKKKHGCWRWPIFPNNQLTWGATSACILCFVRLFTPYANSNNNNFLELVPAIIIISISIIIPWTGNGRTRTKTVSPWGRPASPGPWRTTRQQAADLENFWVVPPSGSPSTLLCLPPRISFSAQRVLNTVVITSSNESSPGYLLDSLNVQVWQLNFSKVPVISSCMWKVIQIIVIWYRCKLYAWKTTAWL